MNTYNLTIVNKSNERRTFIVYQKYLYEGNPIYGHLRPLAWRVDDISANNTASIKWDEKYSLVWGQPGILQRGQQFMVGQNIAVDPQGANQVTFAGQPPSFSKPVKGNRSGSLIISTNSTFPPDQFAVGIGMSGFPSVVEPLNPNFIIYIYSPTPTYWIASVVLHSVREGDILDTNRLSSSELLFDDAHSATYVYTGK